MKIFFYNPNTIPTNNSRWRTTLFYNTLIRAYLNFGQHRKSLHLFTLMLAHQTPPNSHTFPSIIKAATHSCLSIGTSLHAQVINRGVLYDPFIQTSLLCMYSQFGDFLNACKVFDEISHPCIVEYNAMLDAYAKNGDVGSACFLLKSMPKRDVVSWTSVISGFAKNGFFGEAIRLFREMMLRDDAKCGVVKPNEATYVSVLSSCANLDERGVLCMGKQIHGYIGRNEACVTVFIGTALIDFYGKVGCLSNAIKVYNQMVVKKSCTWNAIISSLANNGREEQALDTFKKMKEEGLNRFMKQLFWEMKWEAGYLNCSHIIAVNMWLYLSIHAGVDRWGVAADIRKTMAEARIRKVPACSLIDCI